MLNYIVVVDDDPLQTLILRDHFEERGATRIVSFNGGAEARDHLDREAVKPDLIICDLHMPEGDGVELMSFLKGGYEMCPLVILSGASDATFAAAKGLSTALGLNLLGGLAKPLNSKQLDEMLAEHF